MTPKPLRLFSLLLIIATLTACNHTLTSYVNPLVGTDAHGHTYPGAIVPFGMMQVSPDTRLSGWDGCSAYHYSDDTIYGFSHTHLSGTGCEDYGDILLMPFSDSASIVNTRYCSTFSHSREKAEPGYYSVILDKNQILAELTATQRTGIHRYSYPYRDNTKGVIIDLTHRDKTLSSSINLSRNSAQQLLLTGHRFSSAWAPCQKLFFALSSDAVVSHIDIYKNGQCIKTPSTTDDIDCDQIVIWFDNTTLEAEIHVAISAVDEDGAVANLTTDNHCSFDQARQEAHNQWETSLATITVDGNRDDLRNFYTALYHCFTSPYLYSDVDGRYRGMDDSIHVTDSHHQIYTVFSLWDTYRTLHPLLTLIDRRRTADFIYTFAKHYEQGGELTMWELSNYETHCMIGYHAVPIILEAAMAGILDSFPADFNRNLLTAMIATSNRTETHRSYAADGYLSSEVDNESVSKTLEYAYDDWCIAQYTEWLQRRYSDDTTDYEAIKRTYYRRAQSYQNIMDPQGFMHARRNGGFVTPFSPAEVNNHYTEANAWQYSTYVVHDLNHYFTLLGGTTAAEAFLDSLFTANSTLEGRQQSDITGLIGQYAHGNEPSHHVAYLYACLNRQYKTAQLVRSICHDLYSPTPDGLCGNEDCGQMSAWFVMSALGFYPITPGSGFYCIGSPLFQQADIQLDNGNHIFIECDNQRSDNCYIQHLSINGTESRSAFLRYRDLVNGCVLHFTMGSTPNEAFGSTTPLLTSVPERYRQTSMPVFSRWQQRFDNVLQLGITSRNDDAIYFTLDGSTPDTTASCYTEPITIESDVLVSAVAYNPNTGYSPVARQHLTRFVPDRHLTYITTPDPQYHDSGEDGLVDRLHGIANYRIGGWQGWQTDMKVVVDMLEVRPLHHVVVECLSDCRSWIFLPAAITVEVSTDGSHYQPFGSLHDIATQCYAAASYNYQQEAQVYRHTINGSANARYLRITATNYGPLPQWHISAGEPAWLFCDEIEVD